ncbi:MAG: hypothetical protein HLUCCX10_07045 [Algoriphagus marincola HL-49]|jgi:hypothetical protein|uniref:Uncharacterized protein n=1 Tax=Algoriphagus marincola HL-49 TaxID=1305737 RepID=A0A0N8KGI6_9BACT|nr:MAG: hypothetical protein HLUCCX10_07045 [Algoriphagus marincola HL-49]
MSSEEKEVLKEKLKSAILNSGEDFLKMKKKLKQNIVVQIDGKIVTRTPDYFLRKRKKEENVY